MGAGHSSLAFGAGVAAVCAAALPALAEEARMTGRFPAQHREAAMLQSLSVERFSGRDGAALGFAIERALAQPDARGTVHFDLVGATRRSGGRADGTLSGTVSSGVEDSQWKRKDKKCVERASGKCVKEEEAQVNCTRRVVNLTADMRIVRAGDGRIVYSVSKPLREDQSWCQGAGERAPATAEETIARMIDTIASQVRYEIAPRWESYSIRFRETTKGLPKDLAARFRASMKQSERNLAWACGEWAAIDAASPNNPSILFDLGLCAEAGGEYERALGFYRRASPLLGRNNEADRAIGRIDQIRAALADDAARDRR